jgi:hypothetical protein
MVKTMGERPQLVLRLVVASSPEPMEVTSIDLYAKGVVIVEDPVPDIELDAQKLEKFHGYRMLVEILRYLA